MCRLQQGHLPTNSYYKMVWEHLKQKMVQLFKLLKHTANLLFQTKLLKISINEGIVLNIVAKGKLIILGDFFLCHNAFKVVCCRFVKMILHVGKGYDSTMTWHPITWLYCPQHSSSASIPCMLMTMTMTNSLLIQGHRVITTCITYITIYLCKF